MQDMLPAFCTLFKFNSHTFTTNKKETRIQASFHMVHTYNLHMITWSDATYRFQPLIWILFTSGFFSGTFGTVTVRTPFSIEALTSSSLAFSGSQNLLKNLPRPLSTRCHLSFLSSFSTLLSPLIWSTLPSSTSTFTSSFFSPGKSALNTCASGVSFQSTRALAKVETSLLELSGAHMSDGNWSNMFRLPKKLGIRDILMDFTGSGCELRKWDWDGKFECLVLLMGLREGRRLFIGEIRGIVKFRG